MGKLTYQRALRARCAETPPATFGPTTNHLPFAVGWPGPEESVGASVRCAPLHSDDAGSFLPLASQTE